MLRLSKKVEYALMALKHLANAPKDHLVATSEICEHYGLPFDTTAKVLQVMHHAGWLASVKGVRGGYQLSVDLNLINFMQLCWEIDPHQVISSECLKSDGGHCDLGPQCNIKGIMHQLQDGLSNHLRSLKLGDLLLSLPSNTNTSLEIQHYESIL